MPHIDSYEFSNIIGRGRFGRVYKGVHSVTGQYVAIKLEDRRKDAKLLDEAKLIEKIGTDCNGIPDIIKSGSSRKWNYMIMSFLGPNLEELFIYCKRRFSLKTTLMLASQILRTIEHVHDHGIVHRDIKPDNYVMGFGDTHKQLFLIDFGLSTSYRDEDTFEHKKYIHKSQFTGSFRYSSINNHKGIQQSRRDDLESIGYMLIYFYKGRLPWQNIKSKTRLEKLKKTYTGKKHTTIEELCQGCPKEFKYYITYCRKLGYDEKPNYNYIHDLFNKMMKRYKYRYDLVFDWDEYSNTDEKKQQMMSELLDIKKLKIHKTIERERLNKK